MKHAKPKKKFKNALLLIFIVIILALIMIFAIISLYEYANSGLPGYKEKPYFSVEPWTIGVELVTEEPEPTYPIYFKYNTEETETDG